MVRKMTVLDLCFCLFKKKQLHKLHFGVAEQERIDDWEIGMEDLATEILGFGFRFPKCQMTMDVSLIYFVPWSGKRRKK